MKTIVSKLLEILHPKMVKNPSIPVSNSRLSDTVQVQQAFRRAAQLIFDEAFKNSGIPSASFFAATEIIDGKRFLEGLSRATESSWETLGFKPEHLRLLKSLCSLLELGARVEATPTNLRLFEPLFCPVTPTTPASAEAFEEVVNTFGECIGPKGKP